MLQRATDQGQLRRRAAGGVTRRFGWMLAALGSVSVLGLATAVGLTLLRLPKFSTYTGQLKDTSQVQTLGLPGGVAVKTLMVRDGTLVSKGQTLARLDIASISATIRGAEAEILADRQLLTCLQSSVLSVLPALVGAAAGSVAVPDAARPALFADAALDCAQQTAPHRAALEALDANDALLGLRSTLIDRRIKLELAHLSVLSVGRDDRARLVLGLSWEQTRIERIRAANQQRRHEITTRASANLAERTRLVKADLQQNELELADLAQLLQDPRVISPVDAIILKTQDIAPGQVFDHPTPLIDIVPTGPQRFEVRLGVSSPPPAALRENAVVRIELIGTAMSWPSLTGRITGMESGVAQMNDGTLQVRITLEPESAAALAEMSAQSRFVGDGSAIAVQAVIPEQPLATAMMTAWAQAAPMRTTKAP